MEFKDRKKETKELNELFNTDKFELLILYGRRRIGKTELILHTTQKKKRIYYLAVGERNIDKFYEVCLKEFPEVSNLKKDYEILFNYLKDKAEVIILDEFQNLVKEDNNILHTLQSLVDTNLKNSKLKLVLLGSSVSMINSKVLAYQSPLYGRRTATIKLKSVSLSDLHEFFSGFSMEELIEIYGFADGIPYYLIKLDRPLWNWLKEEIKQEKSFLRDEVDFLMKYEFDDPSTYKLILQAIANGKTKINEIKDFVKLQRTDISPYLKNLIEVDLIEREIPANDNVKSRNGRYYLKDNFLKFWFRYIYPNLSWIVSGIFDISSIKKDYSEYLGKIFEDVVKQYLIKSSPFKLTKIGRWWHKDKEIDLIGINESTEEILFSECKWSENVDCERILKDLSDKTKSFDWKNKSRKESYAIFAKSFKKKITEFEGKKVYCFNLKDIEKELKTS
jgi:AAA+ ATPase superfamily predicted ATPase